MSRAQTEAMTVKAHGSQVVARIGFAERWLHRARTQCTAGDVTGGLLTLALADAEVRYALEVGGWRSAAACRPARSRRAHAVLAAAAALVGLIWVSWPDADPTAAASVEGPPIVRFAAPGRVLSLVAVSTPPAAPTHLAARDPVARPATGQTLRSAVRTAGRALGPVASAAAALAHPSAAYARTGQLAAVAVPPSAGHLAASPASGTPTPLVFSDADIIDMVLAASRALQGSGP